MGWKTCYTKTNYASIYQVTIYAGDLTSVPALKAGDETMDNVYRLLPGITDMFYTVLDLPAEGTYVYKVKGIFARMPLAVFRDAVRSAVLTILTTFSGALSRHRRQSSRPSMRIAAGISGWNGWLGRRRGRLWKSGLCR